MKDGCKQPCVCPQVFTVLYLPNVSTISVNIVVPLQTDLCLPLVRYPVSTLSTKFKVKCSIVYLIPGYLSMLLIPTNESIFLPLSHQPSYPYGMKQMLPLVGNFQYTVENSFSRTPKHHSHASLSSSEDNYSLVFLFSYRNTVSYFKKEILLSFGFNIYVASNFIVYINVLEGR